MSDPETFLSRWSRRKREMRPGNDTGASALLPRLPSGRLRPSSAPYEEGRGEGRSPQPQAREDAPSPGADLFPQAERGENSGQMRVPCPTRGDGESVARPVPVSADLPSDAASLPSIESITAETDIRGFLASGVPPELTRAALRRAWACDPNIRNFVGLADYDWDFNAAGSIAGFGPLQMNDDVEKMAAQIVAPNPREGDACNFLDPAPARLKAEQVNRTTATDTSQDTDETHDRAKFTDEPASEKGVAPNPKEFAHRGHGSAAAQDAVMKPEDGNVLVRQQHGRALPK